MRQNEKHIYSSNLNNLVSLFCSTPDVFVFFQKQCKNCSGVFCESCVSNELPLPSSILPETVCTTCYSHLLQQYASTPTWTHLHTETPGALFCLSGTAKMHFDLMTWNAMKDGMESCESLILWDIFNHFRSAASSQGPQRAVYVQVYCCSYKASSLIESVCWAAVVFFWGKPAIAENAAWLDVTDIKKCRNHLSHLKISTVSTKWIID